MEQLKPCPFCGKKPRISCAIEGKIRWTISCHEEVSIWRLLEDIKDIERAEAKAAKAWNRRVSDHEEPITEIVRCRDCVYKIFLQDEQIYKCKQTLHRFYKADHFCSYGRRAEHDAD